MATDTARVNLELASGKNEDTAPFQQTAQRRRQQQTETPAVAPAPTETAAPVMINVPLSGAAPMPPPPADSELSVRPRQARPTWIASIGAVVVVAAAVWGVMFQRMPAIDPGEVIQRNLADARAAMADGRYTDPSERSALHYYSTVLALDPRNADALAGIDEIAERHITNARVLLANKRIAEAGLAIEKARRVRPDHSAFAELDTQLRTELRKLLLASNTSASTPATVAGPSKQTSRPSPVATQPLVPQVMPVQRASRSTTSDHATQLSAATLPQNVNGGSALAALTPVSTERSSQSQPSEEAGGTPIVTESTEPVEMAAAETAALPESAPSTPEVPAVEPKLIKMVQPTYPQEALMRGIEGWVDVSLEVNAAGDVIAPRIEQSSRGRMFNRAALSAVQQWKYEPRPDGASTERVRVRVQFKQTK